MTEDKTLQSIEGRVSSVIFMNEANGYAVLELTDTSGEETVLVGCVPMAAPGEHITAWGSFIRHPSYGVQFKAERTERTLPDDAKSIYAYLSSGVIKGVGPATAALIVSSFGASALEVMRDKPELLSGLKGFSKKKAADITKIFREQTGMRMLMEYLAKAALSPVLAIRLYRCYGDKAMELLRQNPYILATERIGAGFSAADELAISQGMEPDAPERVEAALLFELQHNADNGHTFLPREKLTAATAQLIDVDTETTSDCLETLIETGDIIAEEIAGCDACYTAGLYAAEAYSAQRLRRMAKGKCPLRIDVARLIEKIEAEQGVSYAPMQRRALECAAESQVLVVTGGPGTGKTTSVRGILSLFDSLGLETLLAAPTGRAAKRMSELTGRDASTIHRLLEANYSEETDSVTFRRNENDRLNCQALILDECSMIDIHLLRAALCAISSDCRLVLVGDADQLPSVGPGNVLRDILRSGTVPAVRLTDIFRQQMTSHIVLNAHQINDGEMPELRENSNGFYFMRRRDPEAAAATVVELCTKRLPRNMHIPVSEIQVLTPTRKGPTGTEELNKLLQAQLNPPAERKRELELIGCILREGDRVMQIRNDYDIIWHTRSGEQGSGIFNGDTGYILSVDTAAEMLTVDYDGRMAEYGFEQASELEHAWAVTVHKSQGSEYRAVVLACCHVAPQLTYRSLLYTAVTRAQELLVLVGDEQTVQTMVSNNRRAKRYCGLRARLMSE